MTDLTPTELVMPSRGMWLASRGGIPIGTVSRRSGHYIATTASGAALGRFKDLSSALDAVDRGKRRWFGRMGR